MAHRNPNERIVDEVIMVAGENQPCFLQWGYAVVEEVNVINRSRLRLLQ